ncbi:hypothetical protein [Bacillus atrophaeus]|uniref:hypothetical protein n=1 Tax=Bacillus atrophaeus TaxID=1452 RepID=UPI00077A51A5|nr:hypothetical protein [Bacillus atrophaeus]KXZ13254.1 hypothetical protein AXI57_15990 [Bacillus atrophaeus]MED4806340.1 hypothetical protein [Bacillus atrophaeus]UFD97634.1 hypothetical protein [Bacillus atrophaeus]GED04216.1 hypothetical protein BAT02nite_38600 [Bacillus atrophaeus]
MSRELANYSSSGSVVVKRSPAVRARKVKGSAGMRARKITADGKYIPSQNLRRTISKMNSNVRSLNDLLNKSNQIKSDQENR